MSPITTYKEDLKTLLGRLAYTVPLLAVALVGYGYAAANTTVSVDDLLRRYYLVERHTMLASGRFGAVWWAYATSLTEFLPYAEQVIAVMLLLVAATNFGVLFKRVSEDQLSPSSYTAFSCLMVSYPLVNEIWEYTGSNVVVAGGYMLVSLALLSMWEWQKMNAWKYIGISSGLLMVVVASYESLAAVYVWGAFAVMLLRFLYGRPDPERNLGHMVGTGLWYALPLLGGLLLRLLGHRCISYMFSIPIVGYGETQIYWVSGSSCLSVCMGLAKYFSLKYVIYGLWYMPIAVLDGGVIVCLMLGFNLLRRYRRITVLVPISGLLVSLILLSLIQGCVTPYRACQVFATFVAFVGLLLIQWVNEMHGGKVVKHAVGGLVGFVCLYQAIDLNKWLALNNWRSEEEAFVIRTVGHELETQYDLRKPIIVVGRYRLSKGITDLCYPPQHGLRWKIYCLLVRKFGVHHTVPAYFKYVETNVNSVISWSISGHKEEQDIVRELFKHYGCEVAVVGNYADVVESVSRYAREHMPGWPKVGYIRDVGDYIIVNFGNYE